MSKVPADAWILNDWPMSLQRGPIRPVRVITTPSSPALAFWGGDQASGEAGTQSQTEAYTEQTVKLLGTYMSSQDVRVRLEKAKAQLASMKKFPLTPGFMIKQKEAEIRALEEKLALTKEGDTSKKVFRILGWTAGLFGVTILGIATVRIAKGQRLFGG